MPWAARSSARGAKWPSPCRLPVKPWHSTTSGSSSPRADLAGSWMVAGILPRVPGISMFLGLVLVCNSVTAATMHSAMAAKQASRIQGSRVCLACFIWVPLFCFFQVYCTIIKTYSGWFVNCFLFKSSHGQHKRDAPAGKPPWAAYKKCEKSNKSVCLRSRHSCCFTFYSFVVCNTTHSYGRRVSEGLSA